MVANTADVLPIIEKMAPYRRWIDPLLQEAQAQAKKENDRHKYLRTSLALLPADGSQLEYVYRRLLDAEPAEVPVLIDALAPHKESLCEKLWCVVESPEKGKEAQRLRAAAALANYDRDSGKWASCSPLVVQNLVLENLTFLGQWSQAYRPVKDSFLAPLTDIFRDQRAERAPERTLATNLLADYAADQPAVLADLLMAADEKQFAVIYPEFIEQGKAVLPVLIGETEKCLPGDAKDEAKEELAKRQANAAVALLKMDQPAKVWSLLKHSPDSRARSYLIHRLAPLGVDAGVICTRLGEETDVTIRRALLLILGEFDELALPAEDRQALLPKIQNLYRTDTDPGVHASAEWLLRKWQRQAWLTQVNEKWATDRELRKKRLEAIQQLLTMKKAKTSPQWYVTGQGQTMVVIPGPVDFLMGSPVTEVNREDGPDGVGEMQHRKRIGRSFAIAAREVTVERFLHFRKNHPYDKEHAPTFDCPVNVVSWYDATAYCNWLSKQEGIAEEQWCYVPAAGGKYEEGMKLAPHYLHRTGYRLPSEAEWEYACRAGAVTSRYFGETEELLDRYAWYTKTSQPRRMLPGGCLKPNDLGLFDMLGNAQEWCQEQGVKDYTAGEDTEDQEDVADRKTRVLRGGSLIQHGPDIRCAYRSGNVPTYRLKGVGFRPARTLYAE